MQTVWVMLIAISVACVVNVVTQLLCVRLMTILSSVAGGVLLGGVSYALIFWHFNTGVSHEYTETIYAGCAIYLTFSFCFWAFLNLNLTSLRIRILKELYQQPQGLSRLTLTQRYSPDELLLRRIQRLKSNGQIIDHQDRLYLQSRKLLVIYFIMQGLRTLILPKCVRKEG